LVCSSKQSIIWVQRTCNVAFWHLMHVAISVSYLTGLCFCIHRCVWSIQHMYRCTLTAWSSKQTINVEEQTIADGPSTSPSRLSAQHQLTTHREWLKRPQLLPDLTLRPQPPAFQCTVKPTFWNHSGQMLNTWMNSTYCQHGFNPHIPHIPFDREENNPVMSNGS